MEHEHDWLTLHRVRFPDSVDGVGKPLAGPSAADFWRFAPKMKMRPDGLVCNDASWGGFALYKSKAHAEEVFENPNLHLPFLANAVEAWHALVIPYAHRGAVKWRDVIQTDCAIKTASEDPKGPLVVLTTAGYDNPGPHEAQRMKKFFNAVIDVVDHYRTLPGNHRADVFTGAPVDGREGCTMSLWKNDKAMMAAAYKSGEHKDQLDHHKSSAHFDRSSFTRGRVVANKGTWDGLEPYQEGI